jgi:ubiquinone/menaquinone biosynthesis C-methylase UbiE
MIEYAAFNTPVFDKVPKEALSILDVGCGTGVLGKVLKEQKAERLVNGITYSKEEYEIAKQVIDEVWVTDLNNEVPEIDRRYDCIIFSHILEHTYQPESILKNFSRFLNKEGVIIIALPNILHFKQRKEFFKGKFKYSEHGGLMDVTHFRFFDWESAQTMITNAGLKIASKESLGSFPLPFIRKVVPSICKKIDQLSTAKWPGLFGFQFVFVAKK